MSLRSDAVISLPPRWRIALHCAPIWQGAESASQMVGVHLPATMLAEEADAEVRAPKKTNHWLNESYLN